MSDAKLQFDLFFLACHPKPEKEYKFHPKRKWRFDYAFPDYKIAVEFEGGAFINGRHFRGMGFKNDRDKYNEATRMGWDVYCFTVTHIQDGSFFVFMRELLLKEGIYLREKNEKNRDTEV